MRWYLFKNETVYGPYTPEQLTAFLKGGDLVAREGSSQWVSAADDPALADVLSGKISALLDWFIVLNNKSERGPMTRAALQAVIDRGEIGPRDLIRHVSWPKSVPLAETKLYKYRHEPHELHDADRFPHDPEPSSKGEAGASPMRRFLPRVELDFEFTPRVFGLLALCLLAPALVYFAFFSGPTVVIGSEAPVLEGWSIYALTATGRDIRMIVSLPPQGAEVEVVAANFMKKEFRKRLSVPARSASETSRVMQFRMDEMAEDDPIASVKVLYQGRVAAEQAGTSGFAPKLEKKEAKQ